MNHLGGVLHFTDKNIGPGRDSPKVSLVENKAVFLPQPLYETSPPASPTAPVPKAATRVPSATSSSHQPQPPQAWQPHRHLLWISIALRAPELFSQGAFEGTAATHQRPRAPQVWQRVLHPPPPCPGRSRAGREALNAYRCGFPLGIIIPAVLL